MTSLHLFTDQVSGLAAVAIQTRTHGAGFDAPIFGERNPAAIPAESLVSHPAALASGWGNPGRDAAASVDNCESPLGLKVNNVAVLDFDASDWVDDLKLGLTDNELWSDPNQVGGNCQNPAQSKFKDRLSRIFANKEAVDYEECNQQQGNYRPGVVASRSKGFIHTSIIAGVSK